MGTSDFAVPTLKRLHESRYEILCVITQPDRPKGRGKKILPSPVKETAILYDIPVYQPGRIKNEDAINHISSFDADIMVIVSYGQIIPEEILNFPQYGCINVHASLLPKYRGAAPIQRAIMAGEKVTGITTMFMDKGLDTGDVLLQEELEITEDMDHGSLEQFLSERGADLLIATIESIEKGIINRREQDNSKSSYAHMIKREEELINWSEKAELVFNKIRALSPKPGAYTIFNGTRLKLFSPALLHKNTSAECGEIVQINSEGFVVQTGQGLVEIREVQKEGKSRISCKEFLKGFSLLPGNILGGQEE